jgi:hypothetical protein
MEHLTITEAPQPQTPDQRAAKAMQESINSRTNVVSLTAAFLVNYLDIIRSTMAGNLELQRDLDDLRDAVGVHRINLELFHRAVIGN